MDEPIFDPVTYALLSGKINEESAKNFYKAGDTIDISGEGVSACLAGLITSNSKAMHFDLVTDKDLTNVTTITVTEFKGLIRGISGYVDSPAGAVDYAELCTAVKIYNNRIRISLNRETAFTNVTNNTPVVYWGSVKLTLS